MNHNWKKLVVDLTFQPDIRKLLIEIKREFLKTFKISTSSNVNMTRTSHNEMWLTYFLKIQSGLNPTSVVTSSLLITRLELNGQMIRRHKFMYCYYNDYYHNRHHSHYCWSLTHES